MQAGPSTAQAVALKYKLTVTEKVILARQSTVINMDDTTAHYKVTPLDTGVIQRYIKCKPCYSHTLLGNHMIYNISYVIHYAHYITGTRVCPITLLPPLWEYADSLLGVGDDRQ